MTKEQVKATRDIKKGEALTNVVHREDGFFYFLTKAGDVLRAPFARKVLTPVERAAKDKALEALRKAVAERKAQRAAKRNQRLQAQHATKQAKEKARQAKLDEKIAALQSQKAK